MAGSTSKKRSRQDLGPKSRQQQRPHKKQKKQKRQAEYHSDSDSDDNPDFKPVDLLDSDDEDLDNIAVDDVPSGSDAEADSGSNSDSDPEADRKTAKAALRNKKRKAQQPLAKDAPSSSSSESDDNENDPDSSSSGDDAAAGRRGRKTASSSSSKRNDPSAFATSITKILSTKLATGRRADPVLSRSADAHRAAREVVDAALEAKARKQMREQRRLALEKGRVRDVLGGLAVGGGPGEENNDDGGNERGGSSVAETQARERRLRKVAHRGVVVLFRAVREAQERAARAEVEARKGGVFGAKSREEKVSEMSRQGFLDLIASGGGKLKKGGLEEA